MGVVYEEEVSYISSRIRELRRERRLTVQELAYRCDMERSNLSRIEAGRTNLTVKTMCIICNATTVQRNYPIGSVDLNRNHSSDVLV